MIANNQFFAWYDGWDKSMTQILNCISRIFQILLVKK
jgi:uncharacterized protein YukE